MQLRLNGLCAHFNFHKIWIIFTMIFFLKKRKTFCRGHSLELKCVTVWRRSSRCPGLGWKGKGLRAGWALRQYLVNWFKQLCGRGKVVGASVGGNPQNFPPVLASTCLYPFVPFFSILRTRVQFSLATQPIFFSFCISMNYCFIEKCFLNCCCLYKKIESGYASCETES